MSFDTIPILDLSFAKDPSTKPQFLEDLRHALLEVGFLYLKNVGVPEELTQAVIKEGVSFFDLPMEEKFVVPSSISKAPPFYVTCNPFQKLHLLISCLGSKSK
jgi:isopenicillin N synthase-like dioxygenase